MMATELVTAAGGHQIITVLVQNHGFASIGSSVCSTAALWRRARYRNPQSGPIGRRQAAC
jgi:hypothetical protein